MGIEGKEISEQKYLTKLSHERAFFPSAYSTTLVAVP